MCNKRHLPTVWRKGDSPTSSTKLFAVWGSPCSFVHEDTKMDSNVLCLLALKVKWLSIVLQSRFYSFLSSYKQIIKNHQPWPPWFDVSKRIVLVGWLERWRNFWHSGWIAPGEPRVDDWKSHESWCSLQPAEVVKDQSLAAITECAKGWLMVVGLGCFFW